MLRKFEAFGVAEGNVAEGNVAEVCEPYMKRSVEYQVTYLLLAPHQVVFDMCYGTLWSIYSTL